MRWMLNNLIDIIDVDDAAVFGILINGMAAKIKLRPIKNHKQK